MLSSLKHANQWCQVILEQDGKKKELNLINIHPCITFINSEVESFKSNLKEVKLENTNLKPDAERISDIHEVLPYVKQPSPPWCDGKEW